MKPLADQLLEGMNEADLTRDILFKAYNRMDSALTDLNLNRDQFENAELATFVDMIEEKGQEHVFRHLARLAAIQGVDEAMRGKAEKLILEAMSHVSLDESLMETCPVCESPALRFYECKCGFSFCKDYACPFLEESKRFCRKVEKECILFGTEWESCSTYHGDS